MAPPPISSLSPAAPIAGASAPAPLQRHGAAVAPAPPPAAPPPVAPPLAAGVGNPSQHLDPGLGVVVIEFHNTAGAVTGTIPTEQQLQAYRRWEDTRVGPPAEAGTIQAATVAAGTSLAGPTSAGAASAGTISGGATPTGTMARGSVAGARGPVVATAGTGMVADTGMGANGGAAPPTRRPQALPSQPPAVPAAASATGPPYAAPRGGTGSA